MESRTRRLTAAFAVGLVCTATNLAAVHAEASLTTVSGDGLPHEAGFELDLRLSGTVATATAKQVIVNPSNVDREVIYTFDLDRDAAITKLSVELADGRTTSGAVVSADAATTFVPDPGALSSSPDVALLRMVAQDVDGDRPTTYELRVYPVDAGKSVTVTMTWVAPIEYDDGRLSVRIPARGDDPALVREKVNVRLGATAGARGFGSLYAGGQLLAATAAKNKTYKTTAPPQGDLVIETIPLYREAADGAVATFATVPIGKAFGAAVVTVRAPLPSGSENLDYERLLFAIDVSASVDQSGVKAAAELADALMAASPPETRVEAVLFDRTARRVFDEFAPNDHDTRKALAKALTTGPLNNGSDLGAALDAVRDVFYDDKLSDEPAAGFERGVHSPTLIVLITDGMAPLALSPERAVDRLGDHAAENAEVLAITLVPDEAPVPDTSEGIMARLAFRTGGRSAAVRHSEATTRSATLAVELSLPAPLEGPEIDAGKAALVGMDLPGVLGAGRGYTVIGFYYGAAPKKISVRALRNGKDVTIAATRDKAMAAAALPLALVTAPTDRFLPTEDQKSLDRGDYVSAVDEADAMRELIGAAHDATTVTRTSAFVALDRKDKLSIERLDMAHTWGAGVYFRLPPPPEREDDHGFRQLSTDPTSDRTTNDGSASYGRTGELDGSIIKRLITTYVVPKAKICYEKALRKKGTLSGSLTVVVEIARGEVQFATVEQSTFRGSKVEACVAEAAYSIQVPRVALGEDAETIGVARYPLTFRQTEQGKTDVGTGSNTRVVDPLDVDDPLGGLPKR